MLCRLKLSYIHTRIILWCGLDRWRLRLRLLCVAFCSFCFFFCFFFSRVFSWNGYCSCTVQWTVAEFFWLFSTSVDPVHCSRNPQTLLFSNFFIKNRSHGTIYTFKNYFAIVFSVFSFSKIISIQTDPMSELCTYACLGKSSTRMGDLLGSPCVAPLAPLSFYLSKNMCVCHVNGFYCLMYLQLIGTGSLWASGCKCGMHQMVLFVWALISILVHIYGMGSFSLSYIISMSGILGASIHLFCLCYKYVKKEAFYLSKKKKCKEGSFCGFILNSVMFLHVMIQAIQRCQMQWRQYSKLPLLLGGVEAWVYSLSLLLWKKKSIYFSFSCI